MQDSPIQFSALRTDLKTELRTFVCDRHSSYTVSCSVLPNGEVIKCGCPKCLEEAEKEKIIEQEKKAEAERLEKELQIERDFRFMNIEPEFRYKTFDDYKAKTPTQEKALNAVKNLVNQKHGKVILLGSNGVGKTMLASIAAQELRGKVFSMYEISTMIRQSYTIKAEQSELEIVNDLASIPFLAIDELGRTKGGEAEQNWLSYILDKRHTRKLPFMLMSNGHFKKFCKEGGCSKCFENFVDNDILSRLRQDCTVVVIDAPDERMEKN